MRALLGLTIVLCGWIAMGQSSQNEYLEAKRQLGLTNYEAASSGFKALTDDKTFGTYASFYLALTAYYQQDYQFATDLWKQILVKNPGWENGAEVTFWLAYTAFETGKYPEAFSYEKSLASRWADLVHHFLTPLSLKELEGVHEQVPNKQVATYLLAKHNEKDYLERDIERILELQRAHDIKNSAVADARSIRKDKYAVGVVLPFMFESFESPETVTKNTLVFDLYQGMLVGQQQLVNEGIEVELFPYDTKKKGSVTRSFLDRGLLNDVDLVVGPLYPGPNKVMQAYSSANELVMINPLSSNARVVDMNPFSYLFKPSYETMGKQAGNYAVRNFTENKKAFIFYEKERDSIVAANYKEVLQQNGYFVIRFDRLTSDDALEIQRAFTNQFEEVLEIETEEQADSIMEYPGRYVRSRVMLDDDDNPVVDGDGEQVLEYYEMKFEIENDSIGHIFAATSSNILANNLISLAEVRRDTIGIIGYEDWLDFKLVSYNQLERLDISLLATSYFKSPLDSVKARFVKKLAEEPGEYHLIGYELMIQVGRLLKKYGKDIRPGLFGEPLIEGEIMEGLRYGPNNNNQIVPILQLEDLQLVNKN